jgi:hypothetical protein
MTHFEILLQDSKGGSLTAVGVLPIYYQTDSPLRLLVRKKIMYTPQIAILAQLQSWLYELTD